MCCAAGELWRGRRPTGRRRAHWPQARDGPRARLEAPETPVWDEPRKSLPAGDARVEGGVSVEPQETLGRDELQEPTTAPALPFQDGRSGRLSMVWQLDYLDEAVRGTRASGICVQILPRYFAVTQLQSRVNRTRLSVIEGFQSPRAAAGT